MKVHIYTDGACSGNPGPGGWGVVLCHGDTKETLSGAEPNTTNNRMELMAAISGLRALTQSSEVHLVTDSKYVKNGIIEWIHNWKKNNWKTAARQTVKNQDLWKELDHEMQRHEVTLHWVKGHNGHPENEKADLLAREAINKLIK